MSSFAFSVVDGSVAWPGGARQVLAVLAIAMLAYGAESALASETTPHASPEDAVETWERIVRQGYSYSCGAAVLATVLTYDLGESIGEEEVAAAMLARLPPKARAERLRRGFTFADLAREAESLGFRAEAYSLSRAGLLRSTTPAIVHLKLPDGEHFAVLREATDTGAWLADPARGNLELAWTAFDAIWTGVVLLVRTSAVDEGQSDEQR